MARDDRYRDGWHKRTLAPGNENSIVQSMEMFKEGVLIKSWGIVFLGLKKQWIDSTDVIVFSESGEISCSENRLIQLYMASDDSEYRFMNLSRNL